MRLFFRRRIPHIGRILLVESGARGISERLLPLMRSNHGPQVAFDLVTCYPGLPAGFLPEADPQSTIHNPQSTLIFRTPDYPDRTRLLKEIRARRYEIVAIICSGEPILFKWKLAIASRLPAKILIVNENADYFWLDYSHWKTIGLLALDRAGLAGPGAARNFATFLLFPFTLLFLLLYAAYVHSRRALRLMFRRLLRSTGSHPN